MLSDANAHAFKAHHLPLKKDVFLKIYSADPASACVFDEPRFLVEATSNEDIDSNLVRVHDAERLGNEYVLVAMEFVEGGSILARLTSGPLHLMDALTAAVGVLHGVAQLHSSLLVHRDLKPANILLSEKYGRIWPKITHFGSVARLSDITSSVTASRHSALYVPPEGWQEPSIYDVRSDIYQVGLVLGEMVYGPLPVQESCYLDSRAKRELRNMGIKSIQELDRFEQCQFVNKILARRARAGQLLSMCPSQPYVPKALTAIINKATAPDPSNRYQSVSEMIGDLERLSFPNWISLPGANYYKANSWKGWDWHVKPANDGQFVVLRAREGSDKFRRWSPPLSARAACQRVLTST